MRCLVAGERLATDITDLSATGDHSLLGASMPWR
jgi:hypothetical protein